MNRADALRALFAAQYDPVLAAWAAVLHQYDMAPASDVSPYEPLGAFQAFFGLGLISAAHYHEIDPYVFFSGKRPGGEIDRVLAKLRCSPSINQEPAVSKTKFPSNPFGSSTDLVARSDNGLSTSVRAPLPVQQARAPLQPFQGSREIAPTGQRIPLDPFRPAPDALVCRDSSIDALGDVDLRIFCCGQQLQMTVQDMQADGPDGIGTGQVQVIDRILHGTCNQCRREHHHSVAEVVDHDQLR